MEKLLGIIIAIETMRLLMSVLDLYRAKFVVERNYKIYIREADKYEQMAKHYQRDGMKMATAYQELVIEHNKLKND